MKRVLITGATGFCGSYLVRHFVSLGHQVIGTYHPSFPAKHSHKSKNLKFVPLDISNPSQTSRAVKETRPKIIFHLAAQSIAHGSVNRLDETFSVNVGGSINLLNAIRDDNKKCRLVYISSSQVYGRSFRTHAKAKETTPLAPQNPYAYSKYLSELACREFMNRFGLDIVIARPFNHFGAGQAPFFVFSEWCRQIAQIEAGISTQPLRVGNINVSRDFLHVRDVVGAYETIALHGKSGCVYNIATGKAVKLDVYLSYLLRLSKTPVRVLVDKKLFRKEEVMKTSGDFERLKKIGWTPQETAFDALKELLDDWRIRIKKESDR